VPIKKSAKKYMRVTDRKTLRNKIVKGTFRNAIKKTKENIAAGSIAEAQELLKAAIKALDKATQKKVIKKNTAARKKSRLNAAVKKLALKK
jgi:small subunit ribosomal protein S20